jgi:hypothetical protein
VIAAAAAAAGAELPKPPIQVPFDKKKVMVHNDGMALMKYRTTFSLDAEAIRRLKLLASYWNVSQAEVIRRALEKAEREIKKEAADPYDLLTSYHSEGGLAGEAAESYLAEVSRGRGDWREP